MESSGNMELAYNALTRASHVFVKKQPEIHLFAAKFKELSGDIAGAEEEYHFLYSEISPCLLEAIVKHSNMEYRVGNKEVAYSIYEKIIAAEKEKEKYLILPMLLVHYSRFLYLVAGNLEKAREVLYGSLDQVQLSKPLLEAVIHLETIQPHTKRIDYLDSLVEKFISPNSDNLDAASTTCREEISCIFMEFLDLFGNAHSIRKADKRHAELFLLQKRSLVSKKRRAEDSLFSDKLKVSNISTDAALSSQSVVGAYPNAHNQWAAGYGPQNSQTRATVESWLCTSGRLYSLRVCQLCCATNAHSHFCSASCIWLLSSAISCPGLSAAKLCPTISAAATFPQPGSAPPPYHGTYY